MNLSVFVFFAFISLCVVAKPNYNRKGYEKIWLYYCYRVDQYHDEASRTVGVKCRIADYSTKACLDPPDGESKYIHCDSGLPNTPCTFRQFLSHISGNKQFYQGGNYDGKNTRDFNAADVLPGGESAQKGLFNPDAAVAHGQQRAWMEFKVPPWCIVKDGGTLGYTKAIVEVGKAVGKVRNEISEEDRKVKGVYFQGVDVGNQRTVLTRKIDNDFHFMERLKPYGYEIKVDRHGPLGWTFNRVETINANKAKFPNIEADIDRLINILGSIVDGEMKKHENAIKAHEQAGRLSALQDAPSCPVPG